MEIQKLRINGKQKARVAVCAVFCGALTVGALSGTWSMGQNYARIYVDGQEIGAVAGEKDAKELIREAKKEAAAQTEGYAYTSAEVSVETGNGLFHKLLEKEELQKRLKQVLSDKIWTDRTVAAAVASGGYSAEFASEEEAEEFLTLVKSHTGGTEDFEVVWQEVKTHCGPLKQAVLRQEPEQEKETGLQAEARTEEQKAYDITAGIVKQVAREPGKDRDGNWPLVRAGILEYTAKQLKECIENPSNRHYKTGTVAIDFAERVYLYEGLSKTGNFALPQEQAEEVTKEKETNKIYVVEAGDCLSTIAEEFETSVDKLVALNELEGPEAVVYTDQQLTVAVPQPDIFLRIVEGIVEAGEYRVEDQIVENDSWYNTQETVLQEGAPGQREVNLLVTYENGVELARSTISETVLKPATPGIIERGTLIPPTYIKPLSGGRLTSGFGSRWGRMHKGIDWATSIGTNVYASSAGTVAVAGAVNGYGYAVYINHADGRQTRYGHLSKVLVSPGQSVEQGQTIALSGNTGRSTGPHVHFEILMNGSQVNPLKYIN